VKRELAALALRRKAAKTSQGRSGATVRKAAIDEARRILLDRSLRSAYDKQMKFTREGVSTFRVQQSRAQFTKKERRIKGAIEVGARRIRAHEIDHELARGRLHQRKVVLTRRPTSSNKSFNVNGTIVVQERTRHERRRDRRLKKFVAVERLRR
jgi:hypothetical protein